MRSERMIAERMIAERMITERLHVPLGAAGGAIDEAEARKLARDTVRIAAQASRRFSGFTW